MARKRRVTKLISPETIAKIYTREINTAIEAAGFKHDKVVAHMKKDKEVRVGEQKITIVSNWTNKRGQLIKWKWFIEGTLAHWIEPVRAKALHWISSTKQDFEQHYAGGARMRRIEKFFKYGSKPKVHAQLDKPGTREKNSPVYQWGKSDDQIKGRWSAKGDAAWKKAGFKETQRYKKIKGQGEAAVQEAAKQWYWKDILKGGKNFNKQYDNYSMGHMVSGIEGSGDNPVVSGRRIARKKVEIAIKKNATRIKNVTATMDFDTRLPADREQLAELEKARKATAGYLDLSKEKDFLYLSRGEF